MIIKKKLRKTKIFPDSAFWVGGKHTVLTALNNKKRIIHRIVIHKKIKDFNNDILLNKHKITFEEDIFFKKIFRSEIPHQGYAILIEKIVQNDFKNFVKFELNNKKNSNIVALDGVNDPRNIGSIIRSACAFNIDAILVNKKDFNSKSFLLYKTASGAMDLIHIFEVSNINNEINFLKKENYFIAGMDSNSEMSMHNFPLFKKNLLIFGSEENGLKNTIKNSCDNLFKIPINEKISSLNVSNACAATFGILNYIQR